MPGVRAQSSKPSDGPRMSFPRYRYAGMVRLQHRLVTEHLETTDANDTIYHFRASEDYDPSAHLAEITAPLLAINSADDFVNPPELPMMLAHRQGEARQVHPRANLRRDPRTRDALQAAGVWTVPGRVPQIAQLDRLSLSSGHSRSNGAAANLAPPRRGHADGSGPALAEKSLMLLLPGTQLGPYEVLGPVGIGGMGEVYRARDSRLGRDVALKVLQASPASEPNQSERLLREARAAAALNHPNICAVFDVGDHHGVPFFVMELLEGDTLDHHIAQQPLSITDVVNIGTQIALALEAAHGKGIVHRDIKPSNIFVTTSGAAKILDFGIANLIPVGEQADAALTADPAVAAGTLPYMAPEQLRGEPADARTDIYASGVVLYEMATGERPFREQTPLHLMNSILYGTPAALNLSRADVPSALEQLIAKCLEREPDRRCQSALELRTRLKEVSRPGADEPLPSLRKPSHGGRRVKA